MTTTPTDDQRLLAVFATNRDEQAFATLMRQHGPMVAGVCYRILGRSHEADDAAQAVFITLARKAATMTLHANLAGWLHRCATHVARRFRDAAQVRRIHEAVAVPLPEERDQVIEHALDEALTALPDRYRLPLIFHHLQGQTQEDIAASLKVAPGTIAWRLHHGRELLRRRLLKAGIRASVAVIMSALAEATASAHACTSALAATTMSNATASDVALDWAAEVAPGPVAFAPLGAIAASSALLVVVLAVILQIHSTRTVASEAPPGFEQGLTDAADCYRSAVAALPPDLIPALKRIRIDPFYSPDAAQRRHLRIERILAEAPEVLRWWHQGAQCATCRFNDDDRAAGGMRSALSGMLTEAAMLELDRSLAAEDSAAFTQANDAMRVSAQCATPGCLAADVDAGLSLRLHTVRIIAQRVLAMKPAAAEKWLEVTGEWPAIDSAAALDGELTLLRKRQHDAMAGDIIADLASRLERRAFFSRTIEIDGQEASTAALAEAWGEDGALLDFVQQAAAMTNDHRSDYREQAARLILQLASQPTDGVDNVSVARRIASERGAAVLDPLFMPLERHVSAIWKLLADRPTIQIFADAENRSRDALAANPFIDDIPYAPHYASEQVDACLELLRAALTAQATGSGLEASGARWPAPYGPMRVRREGDAVILESARCAFNHTPIGLRLTALVKQQAATTPMKNPRPNQ
jgi:RNA polymerase sigma factor (sigma-70 family)